MIISSDWLIEAGFANRYYSNYIQELNLIAAGADYKAFGFSERRKESFSHRVEAGDYVKNLFGNTSKGIGWLTFSGPLMSTDGASHYGIQHLVNMINEYDDSPDTIATVLDLDTGGGDSIAAIKAMNAIESTKKPFLIHVTGMSASGGVLMTTKADEIIAANNGVQIGSIGAYWSITKQMLDFYKEDVVSIYSDFSGDKNKAIRALIENDDDTLIKERINKLDKYFMNEVSRSLPLNDALKKETLRGGMFGAKDAKKRGLIHGIGNKNYVINRVNQILKYKSK